MLIFFFRGDLLTKSYFTPKLIPIKGFKVISAQFCCFSAVFRPLHCPNRHKIDVYTITIHPRWGPGHKQVSGLIFILSIIAGLLAACLIWWFLPEGVNQSVPAW